MRFHSSTARRRALAVVGVTATLGLMTAGALSTAANGSNPATGAQPATTVAGNVVPGNVALFRTNTSLLGVHRWYQQMLGGHPVVGGLYAIHTDTSGPAKGQSLIWDGRVTAGPLSASKASVTVQAAMRAAAAYTKAKPITFVKPSIWVLPGTTSHLVWKVSTVNNTGGYVSYVDASTGSVLSSYRESQSDGSGATFVNGKASTFDPNPVVKLQDESLTDQNDSNAAVPKKGYSTRKLKHLDGSHTLVGEWAKIVNSDIAHSADNTYMYKRADDRFEQVMGYYALDTEESYYQKLGFDNVNNEAQKIQTDAMADDNSWYLPSQDLIQTGTGGVDDAEDPEVVWHEDGHATQDAQVPGFGQTEQAGAIGEGFGDYMAVTMGQQFGKDTNLTPTTCVMDWDSTSYTPPPKHCLRTTDTTKMYPGDLDGEVHDDGEIWSHALWNMNVAFGRDQATTIIIEAQFSFSPSTDMPTAAQTIVDTAKKLYGNQVAAKTKQAFQDRGIL